MYFHSLILRSTPNLTRQMKLGMLPSRCLYRRLNFLADGDCMFGDGNIYTVLAYAENGTILGTENSHTPPRIVVNNSIFSLATFSTLVISEIPVYLA